jgi:DNA mismatch repair protein MutL
MNSIKENGSASLEERHASLALRLAKAAAIPSGQVMSFEEMEVMIAKLNDTAEQKYTPDGKLICNWLSAEELFKRF